MKYIHTPAENNPIERSEDGAKTTVVVGVPKIHGDMNLGNFFANRLVCAIHQYPPGFEHKTHSHPNLEQIYYVFTGQARIKVADEEAVVGPGGSSHMPPNTPHGFKNVGNDTLIVANISAVVTD